jgi:hypothetical protein
MPVSLPEPIPLRIAALPRDQRGYPVPWFVIWMKDGEPQKRGEGEPDFRILFPKAREIAVKRQFCWICGEKMGVHQVFAIGPMCAINRTTQEPPSHRECVQWAMKACPFLAHPGRRRDDRDLPDEDNLYVAGTMIERNPGVTCLWESGFRIFNAGNGWLIGLGSPKRIDWWTLGRQATRAEVEASIESGYPFLFEAAKKDGLEAIHELGRLRLEAMQLLPAA